MPLFNANKQSFVKLNLLVELMSHKVNRFLFCLVLLVALRLDNSLLKPENQKANVSKLNMS